MQQAATLAVRALALLALTLGADAGGYTGRAASIRRARSGRRFIRSLDFSHRLRVCNAYPHAEGLDVYVGKQIVSSKPLVYKACSEFQPSLKAGDVIDFKTKETEFAAFTVSALPENDAVLLLTLFRQSVSTMAVEFESHVFANLQNAQVAVVNAYRGNSVATAHIEDMKDESAPPGRTTRAEDLRYDTVMAVTPGRYKVSLLAAGGVAKGSAELVALNGESYAVVRCGIEATMGTSYPQELLVYPLSDPAVLGHQSAAARKPFLLAHVAAAVALLSALFLW